MVMNEFPHEVDKKSKIKLGRNRQRRSIKVSMTEIRLSLRLSKNFSSQKNCSVPTILLEILTNVFSSSPSLKSC